MPDPGAASLLVAQPEAFRGQPCIRLRHACGDAALVALQGAQVLSWVVNGQERLFLSPLAHMDGQAAIRGGVPVCFPQFNQRGSLPKHGFARNLAWASQGVVSTALGLPALRLTLATDERSRRWWDADFLAHIDVALAPGALRITLSAHNTGSAAWSFTGALHTYLQVDDIERTQVRGLEGCARWDAVADVYGVQQGVIRCAGEYDSVFSRPAGAVLLEQATAQPLEITQSESWGDVVVWNPAAALCATLSDMPADGWKRMLCIEAAQLERSVAVPAGGHWSGWQQLRVAP